MEILNDQLNNKPKGAKLEIMNKKEAIANLMKTVLTPAGPRCLFGVLFQPDDGSHENTAFGCLFYKDGKLVSYWNTDVVIPVDLHEKAKNDN